MAEKKVTVRRVPEAQVDRVIKDYELDKPVRIIKTANGDGTFDIEVVFSA